MKSLMTVRVLLGTFCMTMASLSMTACEENSIVTPPGSGGNGKAGYVIGTVTDPQGKPLSRATVYIDHTVITGNGPEVSTKTDGSYQVQLLGGIGEWIAKGYMLKQYNNRIYKLLLDPENPEPFTAEEKPVRNFQWKLTGHVPDLSLDLYYGGTVEMYRDPNVDGLNDNENIEFTLTPVGPLIDGSAGKTLKVQSAKRYNTFLKDIPIGRYKISAVYKPTGEQLLVCDAWTDGDYNYQPSVTLDFIGTESATRANQMGVAYTTRR